MKSYLHYLASLAAVVGVSTGASSAVGPDQDAIKSNLDKFETKHLMQENLLAWIYQCPPDATWVQIYISVVQEKDGRQTRPTPKVIAKDFKGPGACNRYLENLKRG